MPFVTANAWGQVAQTPIGAGVLIEDAIVVSATRVKASAFDVPASIDLVDGDKLREGRLQVNLSESLGGVPGIMVQNRQNYAQDLQISVRGFGARSAFGVRGVRVYVDGIPATMPDGQSQISNIDLSSVGRIEVLRGPFSALYGNSSGGVIQVFTEDGKDGMTEPTTSFAAGSYRTARVGVKVQGADSTSDVLARYVMSASHLESVGYRDHSRARRDIANAKFVFIPDAASTLSLVLNHVNLPRADDPLGLTRAQFEANPAGVDPVAIAFNTRKTIAQTQAGAIYERKLDSANTIRFLAYTGGRATVQFQAIPVATQTPASSAGGVIDLSRAYSGADLRWSVGEARMSVVAGVGFDALNETRRGFQNFSGPITARELGVKGVLRRDEENRITAADQYLRASWQMHPQWQANAGVRHSQIRFDSRDHYIVAGNPDDSGKINFAATLPVMGLLYSYSANTNFYLTAGRGFETPTGNELAYSANGATGLNLTLKPARSNTVELGVKARITPALRVNAATFLVNTESEIVTLTNVGGRATFTNAGDTTRRGVEISAEYKPSASWRVQTAYTALDATYSTAFKTCTAAPCTAPTVTIDAGRHIPGVARSMLYGEIVWEPPQGIRAALETRVVARVPVNDLNTDHAPRYVVANARVSYAHETKTFCLSTFARIDNIFDRRYAGSVIVNEGNGRFFEPAQRRNALVGASASWMF